MKTYFGGQLEIGKNRKIMFGQLYKRIIESSIDFPRGETLNKSIWDFKNGKYTLKPLVRRKILNVLGKYKDVDLIDMAATGEDSEKMIHITGSICTNQYSEDSDIDVHIVIPTDSKYYEDEQFSKAVLDWFSDNRDKINGYFGKYPIEVYIQSNINQEYLADACYNIMSDNWLKGPKIVPEDYDPYEDYSEIFDEIRKEVKGVDLQMGELKRDIIDYETIKQAIAKMPKDLKKSFLTKLEGKLKEIENDIEMLYKKRSDLIKTRRSASQPQSKEQAMGDENLKKIWKNKNATFKFIVRYQYLRIIKELKDLLEDGELSPKDVEKTKKIVGGIK